MAVAFVQTANSGTGTSAASKTAVYASAQTAGNCNVVVISFGKSSAATTQTVSTVVDTKGNTYAAATTLTTFLGNSGIPTNGSDSLVVYVAPNILAATAGANTVTVTPSASVDFFTIAVLEYSGVATTSPVDVTSVNFASGPTATLSATSNAATTTNANDLILGAFVFFDAPSAVGSGFTSRVLYYTILVEDKLVSVTGSNAATATAVAGGSGWAAQMIALKAAGGGPTTLNDIIGFLPGSLLTLTPALSLTPSVIGTSGAVLSPTSRDKHQGIGSALPGAVLGLTGIISLTPSVPIASGNVLSGVSRDQHKDAWSAVPGAVLSPTSLDTHRATLPIASGSLVTPNDLMLSNEQVGITQGTLLTLGDLLSSHLQVGIVPGTSALLQSTDAHKGVIPLAPGTLLGLNPAAKLLATWSGVPGTLLTLSSSDTHAESVAISPGVIAALTSRDTHRASTAGTLIPAINWEDPAWDWEDSHFWEQGASGSGGMGSSVLLGLNAVNSAGGTLTDSFLALPGVLFSPSVQYKHQAIGSVVAGNIAGLTAIVGISGVVAIAAGNLLTLSPSDSHHASAALTSQNVLTLRSTVGLHGQVSIVSGSVLSLTSRNTHPESWASTAGVVLTPGAIVFGTIEVPVAAVSGNLLGLTSRDTHRDTASVTAGAVVSAVSSVKHQANWASVSGTVISGNPKLILNESVNAAAGITETLGVMNFVVGTAHLTPGTTVLGSAASFHGAVAFFNPSTASGWSSADSHSAQAVFTSGVVLSGTAFINGAIADVVNPVNPLNAAPKVLTRNRRIY